MRNERDAYYTPKELTLALLERIDWREHQALEPFAGENHIADVLREKGYSITTGDIFKEAPVDHPGTDFFSRKADRAYQNHSAIITNPPYSIAPQCARRALMFSPRVAMLLRLSFLEPCQGTDSSYRIDLLEKLSRVIVLPRVSFIRGGKGTDSTTCAWFVWEPGDGSRELEIVYPAELERHLGQEMLL